MSVQILSSQSPTSLIVQPDIKALQFEMSSFLGKHAPKFCKDLWNLCLSAQDSESGIPRQLLEAKTNELREQEVSWSRDAAGLELIIGAAEEARGG